MRVGAAGTPRRRGLDAESPAGVLGFGEGEVDDGDVGSHAGGVLAHFQFSRTTAISNPIGK